MPIAATDVLFVPARTSQRSCIEPSKKSCEVIDVAGPWLGIDPSVKDIPEAQIDLAPGDILCLYTDGLSEARNDHGELFDLPRLVKLIGETASECDDLDEVADTVFRVVGEHAHLHDDDWTMLLVRRRNAISTADAA
jgi:serine phosphatase RsbU (regulator of sigma subunit)